MTAEDIDDQRDRLRSMSTDDGNTWDLSDNDKAACRSGADAIDIIETFMRTPDSGPWDKAHEAIYALMRELLFRGQK